MPLENGTRNRLDHWTREFPSKPSRLVSKCFRLLPLGANAIYRYSAFVTTSFGFFRVDGTRNGTRVDGCVYCPPLGFQFRMTVIAGVCVSVTALIKNR
jgi:hypothetical protein